MIKKLCIVYVAPARYDDDGYVQRYFRGVVPSNSLSVMMSMTKDMAERKPFPGVDVEVFGYDDSVKNVPWKKYAKMNRRADTKVIVCFAGVQTGQFPRAVDLAMRCKELGIQTMIGGFHVTGVMALFDELPQELQFLVDNGVTIVQGECESPGVLDGLFRDALNDTLNSIYKFPKAPDIENAPCPVCDKDYIKKFAVKWATMDSSRGCPYGCTFCTVINIQGRKMRCRSAERVLDTLRKNHEKGVNHFFFTDDNMARSRVWNDVFDGLIEMKKEGKEFSFMMQVDTQSCKIANFVDKAKDAGCRMVFVGMESVNPANIEGAGKSQNNVEQYRQMVQVWQKAGVLVHVGYIIGFPNDTLESVKTDVQFLRDHVGVDEVSFFMLTPLPGSVDHQQMVLRGDYIDPDFNKYDSFHETFNHPKMAPGEWAAATKLAFSEFYTKENMVRILRRIPREHFWYMFTNFIWYRYSGVYNGTHPMMTGLFRQKDRHDRRSGLPKESFFAYWKRRASDCLRGAKFYVKLFFEFQEIWFLSRSKSKAMNLDLVPGEAAAMPAHAPLELPILSIDSNAVETGDPPRQQGHLDNLRSEIWRQLYALRNQWLTVKRHVAEFNWSGQLQSAGNELRNYLTSTGETLRKLAMQLKRENAGSIRNVHKLESVAGEVDKMLLDFEGKAEADPGMIERCRTFIEEKLIGKFDEMSYRYVKIRRRANQWRMDMTRQLKNGKMFRFSASMLRAPYLAMCETYLAVRFGIAAVRKEV